MSGQAPVGVVNRVAVYAIPGALESDGPVAVRLKRLGEEALARTVGAARYGWHATMKAPFRLADGIAVEDLAEAMEAFVIPHPPLRLPSLALRQFGGFWAVVPGKPAPAVLALAADVVRKLDPWRGPLTADDLAKRHPERLDPRQRELLEEWGYPFVLDEFRFHLTLTDDLDPAAAKRAGKRLVRDLEPVLGKSVPLATLALAIEREPGAAFEVHSIHPLGGAAPSQYLLTGAGAHV